VSNINASNGNDGWLATLSIGSRRYVTAALLCLLAIAYSVGLYRQLPSAPAGYHDFLAYYLPAVQLLHGGNPYYTHLPGVLAAADTPAWFLCFQLLARAAPHTAYWTWFWINVSALTLSLWLLIRESGIRGAEAISIAAIGVMYPPIASNFWFGQSEVFLCFLLVVMLIALRHRWDRVAGLTLAFAVLLRAFPLGLVGYLLVLRQWRAIGWTFVGLFVGAFTTVQLIGWHIIATYFDLIGLLHGAGLFGLTPTLHVPLGLIKHPANLNLGWLVKWFYDRTANRPIPLAITVLAALAELMAVVACFVATMGSPSGDQEWRAFGLWMVTVILISPVAFFFFLCCLLPMIVSMCSSWSRGELPPRVAYAIFGSYLVTTLVPPWGHPLFPILHSVTMALEAKHLHIVHVLTEHEFLSLALAWLAAYWFATGSAAGSAITSSGRSQC
jgi:hypothetical protein